MFARFKTANDECRHTTTSTRGMEAASWKDRKIVANSNVHSFISSSNIQLKIGTEMTIHQSEFTTTRNLIYRTVRLEQRSIFSSAVVINMQARYAVLFLKIVGSAMTVLDRVSMRSASSSSNHSNYQRHCLRWSVFAMSMVCCTKVLCPQNLFSRKSQRYKGCMSRYVDIRILCFWHRHVLWPLLAIFRRGPPNGASCHW